MQFYKNFSALNPYAHLPSLTGVTTSFERFIESQPFRCSWPSTGTMHEQATRFPINHWLPTTKHQLISKERSHS
jgi:hypothetical protein